MAAGIQPPASCRRPSNSAESGCCHRCRLPKNSLNVHISNDLPSGMRPGAYVHPH